MLASVLFVHHFYYWLVSWPRHFCIGWCVLITSLSCGSVSWIIKNKTLLCLSVENCRFGKPGYGEFAPVDIETVTTVSLDWSSLLYCGIKFEFYNTTDFKFKVFMSIYDVTSGDIDKSSYKKKATLLKYYEQLRQS